MSILLSVSGLPSVYELEHIARMFYRDLMVQPGLARPRPGGLLKPAGRHTPAVTCSGLVTARAGSRRLAVGLRLPGLVRVRTVRRSAGAGEKDEFLLCRLLYRLLSEATGIHPPWGVLTGVRPVRLVHQLWAKGLTDEEVSGYFTRRCLASEEKARLAIKTARAQQPVIEGLSPRSCSLYIGIPFCPSRCSYCSFVSRTVERDRALVQPYLDKLCVEIEGILQIIRQLGLTLCTVYIGGGTPTVLTAAQLRQLMGVVGGLVDLPSLQEYTVEAGRPDCTDEEKLRVLLEYGATRISINPQTFSDAVLRAIGRRHTAREILQCYETARRVGHKNINMDLIAGLPGDTAAGFAASLQQAVALRPENITVHTLTLKRASSLVIDHSAADYGDVAAMVGCSQQLLQQAGYVPYYLYRQKATLQNLENIGFSLPGFEGLYNIYIMEELHTIFSAGAGGSTKLKQPGGQRIERIFNYKYPAEYVAGFQSILERKKRIGEFYGCDLDTEAPGRGGPAEYGGQKP